MGEPRIISDQALSTQDIAGFIASGDAVCLRNCKLNDVDFDGADLMNWTFEKCELPSARFDHCVMDDVSVTGCRSIDATFRSARFSQVQFTNCDLSNVSFAHGKMADVDFTGCKMLGANLTDISVADLRTCDLGGLQMSDARRFKGAIISKGQAADLLGQLGLKVVRT